MLMIMIFLKIKALDLWFIYSFIQDYSCLLKQHHVPEYVSFQQFRQ